MKPEKDVDVLVFEPDPAAAEAIAAALPSRISRVFLNTVEEVEEFLESRQPRLFLCADDLPGETGLMFLARTEERWPGMKRVLMAPDLDGELFFHAMREVKIFSYLSKPVDRGELIRTVHHAILGRGGEAVGGQDTAREGPSEMASWLRALVLGAAVILGGIVVLAALLFAFGALYEAKSLAGIDVFPTWHLADLFRR
jgi:DNA-binding NtrC family response regulator